MSGERRLGSPLGTCETDHWPNLRQDIPSKQEPHTLRGTCTNWQPVDPPTKPGDAPLPEAAPELERIREILFSALEMKESSLDKCDRSALELAMIASNGIFWRNREIAKLRGESPASTPAPQPVMGFGDWCDSKGILPTMGMVEIYASDMVSRKLADSTPPQPPGKWSKAMAEVQPCGHTNAQHLYHDSGDFPLQVCSVVAAHLEDIDLAPQGASGRTEAQQGHVPDPASGKTGAGELPTPPQPASDSQIKHMVERFLQWKLPDNFNPDGGISFKKAINETHPSWPQKNEPVGTNLFDAAQAEELGEFIAGTEAVRFIRCMAHRNIPQLNTCEAGGAECSVCALQGHVPPNWDIDEAANRKRFVDYVKSYDMGEYLPLPEGVTAQCWGCKRMVRDRWIAVGLNLCGACLGRIGGNRNPLADSTPPQPVSEAAHPITEAEQETPEYAFAQPTQCPTCGHYPWKAGTFPSGDASCGFRGCGCKHACHFHESAQPEDLCTNATNAELSMKPSNSSPAETTGTTTVTSAPPTGKYCLDCGSEEHEVLSCPGKAAQPGPSCTVCGAAMAYKCLSCGSTPEPTQAGSSFNEAEEREAFEKWATTGRAIPEDVRGFHRGRYMNVSVTAMWETWLAARRLAEPRRDWLELNDAQAEASLNNVRAADFARQATEAETKLAAAEAEVLKLKQQLADEYEADKQTMATVEKMEAEVLRLRQRIEDARRELRGGRKGSAINVLNAALAKAADQPGGKKS